MSQRWRNGVNNVHKMHKTICSSNHTLNRSHRSNRLICSHLPPQEDDLQDQDALVFDSGLATKGNGNEQTTKMYPIRISGKYDSHF